MLRSSLLLLLLLCVNAYGQERLRISGFGTLGLTHADSRLYGFRPDVAGDRGLYSGDYDWRTGSLLGLHLELTLTTHLDAVTQAVLRDRAEDTFNRAMELAFVRYSPAPAWTLRLGRTGLDIFQLTDYRNLGYSYAWTRPPVEFYGSIPYRHLDGGDITYVRRADFGLLRAKVYAGKSEAPIIGDEATTFVKLENIYGIVFEFERDDWRLRLSTTQVEIKNAPASNQLLRDGLNQLSAGIELALLQLPSGFVSFKPGDVALAGEFSEMKADIQLSGKNVAYTSLGANYDPGLWFLQGELGQVESNSGTIPTLYTGYISLGRRIEAHTPYAVFSIAHARRAEINTPRLTRVLDEFSLLAAALEIDELKSLVDGGLAILDGVKQNHNFYRARQKSVSLGWRWDALDSLAVKAQWDHVWLDRQADTFWIGKSGEAEKASINIFSLNMSVLF